MPAHHVSKKISIEVWDKLVKESEIVHSLKKHKIDSGAAITNLTQALKIYHRSCGIHVRGNEQAATALEDAAAKLQPLLKKLEKESKHDFSAFETFLKEIGKDVKQYDVMAKQMEKAVGFVKTYSDMCRKAWKEFSEGNAGTRADVKLSLQKLFGAAEALQLDDEQKWGPIYAALRPQSELVPNADDDDKLKQTFGDKVEENLKAMAKLV